MIRDVTKAELSSDMSELFEACGVDAQGHPLVLDGKVVRFKANPVVKKAVELIDLNSLWKCCDMEVKEHRLGMRAFYRDMGYSLCGYRDVFGEQLDDERNV